MPSHDDPTAPSSLGYVAQLALAAAMAALLLPAGVQSVRVGGVSTWWSALLVGALLGLHLCVATARRWPRQSFVGGALACAALLAAPDIDGVTDFVETSDYSPILLPSTLCFLALLYAVSAHSPTPWPNMALGVGLGGSCLTLARLWGFTGTPIETWAWWLLLGTTAFGGTVAAWALGRYRVTRDGWAQELAERAIANERRHIAREMHDVVAHSLAVMVRHAEAGRLVAPGSPERAPEIFATIADSGREALVEMRGLLGVLRDEAATTEPQPGLKDLPALVDGMQSAGVKVSLTVDDTLQPSAAVGLTIYRVVQEALTNVARHAGPLPSARVSAVAVGEGIRVRVENAGETSTEVVRSGRGLIGMQERVDAVGGDLEVGPTEHGWLVEVRVPC